MLWLATAMLLFRQVTGVLQGSRGLSLAIIAMAVVLIGLQLFFEGWRKPMLPAAAALLLLALLPFLLPLLRLPTDGLAARLALGAAALLLAATTGLTWLRPAVSYPQPGGRYPVIGVTALPVVGESPAGDVLTLDELRHPPPLVKLWYPAQAVAPPGLFDTQRLAERRKRFGERGQSLEDPAIVDAPPLDLPAAAPLLFYLPGWPGTSIESAALVRELVSHGYYVATVEYPARQTGMSAARFQALKAELERPFYYGSDTQYHELVEVSIERVRSRSLDTSAALDRLIALASAADSPFAGRYDARRAGAIGFSMGGAVAVQTVNRDARFVAAINLDGRHWGDSRADGAKRPILMISEPLEMPGPALLNSPNNDLRYNAIEDTADYTALLTNLARYGGMHVIVAGALHFNFSDLCLTSPLSRLTGSGSIAPRRGYAITNAYVLAWFDRALKGIPSPLLDTTVSPFPEVAVRYWPAPSGVASTP